MIERARQYPVLSPSPGIKLDPISFVVVHFCDDYRHNFLRSQCASDPLNQLIHVDNRGGHRFDTLSAAFNFGLDQARHDLVIAVHEDVVLVDHWQETLQASLDALAAEDPGWGLAGAVGYNRENIKIGHWSDPYRYQNSLAPQRFAEVSRLDEQLLIFRQSTGLRFDADLPSIHNIGRDISSTLTAKGRKIYAIEAPTIHKYANQHGELIETPNASPKIAERHSPASLAEWKDSNDYLLSKWPEWDGVITANHFDAHADPVAEYGPPIILVSRGGSGSRLLSTAIADLGVHIGNDVNKSGDSMEMVDPVYRALLSKYQRRAMWQRDQIVPRLRAHAKAMLDAGHVTGPWGLKLPESILVLPELAAAFPGARYVHLIRDPLATCLRRTHMTARFDNAIGRTAIRAAYEYCELDIEQSLQDRPEIRMAHTTRHQLEMALGFAGELPEGRYIEIRFEDVLGDPGGVLNQLAERLGLERKSSALIDTINPDRAMCEMAKYPDLIRKKIEGQLEPLRRRLGYVDPNKPLKPIQDMQPAKGMPGGSPDPS